MPKLPTNILERRAMLLVDRIEEQAKRLADRTAAPPPDSVQPKPEQVRAMFWFSPFGEQAPEIFWLEHDMVLAQTGNPIQAEKQAMEKVYPHRPMLVAADVALPEKQVELAEQVRRLVEREEAA